MEAATIPAGVQLACDALAAMGVVVRPEMILSSSSSAASCSAASRLPTQTSEAHTSEASATSSETASAPMELWKALHDLIIAVLFLKGGKRLGPNALSEAWQKISNRGPNAIRFDAIHGMIQLKMRDFGYDHGLPSTSTPPEVLRALCWLMAKCDAVERYVNTACDDAVQGTSLLPVNGSRVWCAEGIESDQGKDVCRSESIGTVEDLDTATRFVSSECGRVWHAARELAAAEERRILILRKLCKLQKPLRPGSSRLLTPTELEAQLRNEDPTMRVELDERIAKMVSALKACKGAVSFWNWCTQNVVVPKLQDKLGINMEYETNGTGSDPAKPGSGVCARDALEKLRVDQWIRDRLGLEVRRPSVRR